MTPVYRILPTDPSPLRVLHSLAPAVMLVSIYQTELDPPRSDIEPIPNGLGTLEGLVRVLLEPGGSGDSGGRAGERWVSLLPTKRRLESGKRSGGSTRLAVLDQLRKMVCVLTGDVEDEYSRPTPNGLILD
jgi:hypothetical protein